MADYLDPEWDESNAPPPPDLGGLAAYGERAAHPIAPSAVRRLGTRRRQRRHAAIGVGALAVVVLAGGVAIGSPTVLLDDKPPVATTPSPNATVSAVPARTVTDANLLQASDISAEGDPRTLIVTPDDIRRDPDRVSLCLPDGWQQTLGATAARERRFGYRDTDTAQGDAVYFAPKYQVVALQFADRDAASRAEVTVGQWLDDCPGTLSGSGYTLRNPSQTTSWYDWAGLGNTTRRFAVIPPHLKRGAPATDVRFDSVGLTRVDDRLMVTDRLVTGTEDNVGLDPATDQANGMQTSAQFSMIEAATRRLAE